MTAPQAASYPGRGEIVRNGFTERVDGLQLVTTKVRTNNGTVYTTAIFTSNTGHVITRKNKRRSWDEFSFPYEARPLYFVTAPTAFEGGRNHERLAGMNMAIGELPQPRHNAWAHLEHNADEV